jgi:hypothetical protein
MFRFAAFEGGEESSMDTKQLGQLILYTVYHVEELGGYTTTIRLVKFLYLIDLEHQRRYGRTLTGLQWEYHLYGPYAFELPTTGTCLGFDLQREDFVNVKGHRGTLLRVPDPQDFPAGLSFSVETLVNGILRVWADQETADLLQYVYHTEPMIHARRGDQLDFSIVPSGTHYYELYIPVQKPTVRRLRESLRSYALDDVDEFVRPTTVYDEVLDEGLRALNDDETPIPDFAGVTPAVEIDELRATLSHED